MRSEMKIYSLCIQQFVNQETIVNKYYHDQLIYFLLSNMNYSPFPRIIHLANDIVYHISCTIQLGKIAVYKC